MPTCPSFYHRFAPRAVVATGAPRRYGNVIVCKGVIHPQGRSHP